MFLHVFDALTKSDFFHKDYISENTGVKSSEVFDSDLNQYIPIESGEQLIQNYSGIRVLSKLQINFNLNNIINKTINIQNNDLNSIQFNPYVNQFIVNQIKVFKLNSFYW